MHVPFLDLSQQNFFYEEFESDLRLVLRNQSFILGDFLTNFEYRFAEYNNSKYSIGVANGSEALEIILRSLDIPKNSEILMPANTFIATAQAVIRSENIPVLVDVNPETYLAEAEDFLKKISSRTRVLLPVHLYGQIPNMEEIKKIADNHNLFIVEDAAQSQGSTFKFNKMGFYSHAAATSFYPGKNLGAWGDGGAIITNSASLFEKIKMIRNYGSRRKYEHEVFGINSRLDEIQAAVLLRKLVNLDTWNNQRNNIAAAYDSLLKKYDYIETLPRRKDFFNNYHLYVLTYSHRDDLKRFLYGKGIETIIHYPNPIYKHKSLARYFEGVDGKHFPITEKTSNEILSLPIYPGMKNEILNYILESLSEYHARKESR